MRTARWAAITCVLIALCAGVPAKQSAPGTVEHQVRLRLVLVPDLDAVQVRCALRHSDPLEVHGWLGCALIERDGTCYVIGLPPRAWYDYDRIFVLGHELLHCIGWTHP